jgi:hypothetical protein
MRLLFTTACLMKFFMLSLLGVAAAWDDVVIAPPSGKVGPVAAVYFAQVS